MAANSRTSVATHLMAALALTDGEHASSALLAESVNTNPVVVRRLLGDLQKAGLVRTCPGKAGGAALAKPATEITIRDIHDAVEAGTFFAPNPNAPNQSCPVSCAMKSVLDPIFAQAGLALSNELQKHTLASVARKLQSESKKTKPNQPLKTRRRNTR